MKTVFTVLLGVLLAVAAIAQTPVVPEINAPQTNIALSFFNGGPYGQSSAMDVTFGDQFTTNNMLQADFITMPGAGYTGYTGGDQWNITPLCPLLATTSLSCGKFMPFVTGQVGLGRIQQGNLPSEQGIAALAGLGAGYDPSGAGKYTLLVKGGWGHFGPSPLSCTLAPSDPNCGHSSNGFFFYSGLNFGGGSSASATQAKVQHINESSAKKAYKQLKSACNHGDKVACELAAKKT
jgi:hypothetical protein